MNQQQLSVQYLDHMGSDLTVVNAARGSFDKESTWDCTAMRETVNPITGESTWQTKSLKTTDAKLIRFLATGYRTGEWENLLDEIIATAQGYSGERVKRELANILHEYKRKAQHWAPFAHPQLQIRMKLPVFLARQFVKHQVGAVWSEESRRYLSDEPGVWFPDEWHSRPDDIKQGSGWAIGPREKSDMLFDEAEKAAGHAIDTYTDLLKYGVAPEEARVVLPLNMMTTVTWTGSLLFWSRVCNQRLDNHAQLAAQELAKQIAAIAQPLFPVSWEALVGE